ncbi:SitI3 family protein [Micromonospora sp. NPDC003197]
MSIDYRLTLAGNIPLEQVAELAAPTAVEASTLSGARMLSADLSDSLGYAVSITSGSSGYYDAEDDGGDLWVWEPASYVDVNFHMRKDTLAEKGTLNMITAVGRILAGRSEDAALVLNGNWLMLTRVGGELRKHNTADWFDEDYAGILPD